MKAYFKKMAIKLLIVMVTLMGSYASLGFTVKHSDRVDTIHTAKIELFKSSDISKEIKKVIDSVEVEQQAEEAVQQVSAPVYSAPSVGANNIKIAGVLARNLMKDETGDNFYLNHSIDGVYDEIGVPYIDFRTNFNTRKTIIYAHSSPSGNGPFQPLQNYHYNKGYYDAHPYIVVNYNGVQYTYQIFSVYVSVADSEESEGLEYYHHVYYANDEWGERIQWYKNNSEYDTGVSVSADDKILILQTCSMDPSFYQRYYRYNLVIMAKLI